MTGVEVRAAVDAVRERMARACARAGRSEPVELVAVTKGHGDDVVDAALAAGLRRLGENRVPELAQKRARLEAEGRGAGVEWHLIGHLQRNKVRQAVPLFELVHSIDSERLAAELSQEAARAGRVVTGLAQVNTSGEEAKSGFGYDEAVDAVGRLTQLPALRIVGLMTMAPFTDDERVLRTTFARARELYERCASLDGFEARHLSMGMSNDYEIAVEEGSTMVRLGTVLFGERQR
jgi:pyridoxal phosphate enzyme (YggS family)